MMREYRVFIVVMLVFLMTVMGCSVYKQDAGITEGLKTHESADKTESAEIVTIEPVTEDIPDLIVLSEPEKYTYDNLMTDVATLQKMYGSAIEVTKLCETADGRDVCDIIIGDQQGENQILIFGAIHAREYITTQLVMRQLIDCLEILSDKKSDDYVGMAKRDLLKNITIHFVPMSNPDGVTISQIGVEGIRNERLRNAITQMECSDYEQWKANADGVDLNRNFDAGWAEYVGSGEPSADRYKGEYPGSAAEAYALIKLTQDYMFKRTISYHTCGALIYWYYLQGGNVLEESRAFAQELSKETGYVMDSDYQAVDAAGYKDWAVYKMGIPSVTIEVGNENGQGVINPVPMNQFNDIWDRNKNVVYATIYNLKYN